MSKKILEYMQERIKNGGHGMLVTRRRPQLEADIGESTEQTCLDSTAIDIAYLMENDNVQ